jgi:hypothetical protein
MAQAAHHSSRNCARQGSMGYSDQEQKCNISNCHLPPRSMGLLGVFKANTAVGESLETFLLHQVVGGSIPAVAMV